MNERISLILKYKNITAAKFADEVDVQRSGISHILSERNKPSLELIQKILKKYPEISPEWLISGKGAMLKTPELFASDIQEINKLAPPDVSENEIVSIAKREEVQKELEIEEVKQKKLSEKVQKQVIQHNDFQHKKIEKIVYFYSDNTFREFSPSE